MSEEYKEALKELELKKTENENLIAKIAKDIEEVKALRDEAFRLIANIKDEKKLEKIVSEFEVILTKGDYEK